MIRIGSLNEVPEAWRGAWLTIGNFDGAHRGHARLIERLRARADADGVPAVALTFDPHPVALLRPEAAPIPLTWPDRTAELLRAAGATAVGAFRTGPWLLELTASDFFTRVVLGVFSAKGMVEGPTFGFGRDRAGNVERLAAWCAEAGLTLEVPEPIILDGRIVSSTRIRTAIDEGRAAEAAELLGRPHRIRGRVARGLGRGATLGFPTANLEEVDTRIPADGVYAAWALLAERPSPIPCAIHVGPNITFGAQTRTVEAHLIDFQGDLYDQVIEIDFLARLRRSRKFSNAIELRSQIERDVADARAATAQAIGLVDRD